MMDLHIEMKSTGRKYTMKKKVTLGQDLLHRAAQAIVHRELYGWPPYTSWGSYQPHRPENKPPKPQDKK